MTQSGEVLDGLLSYKDHRAIRRHAAKRGTVFGIAAFAAIMIVSLWLENTGYISGLFAVALSLLAVLASYLWYRASRTAQTGRLAARRVIIASKFDHDPRTMKWDEYPQPPWNTREEVPAAILALAEVTDIEDSDPYQRFLYAIGNNHCGSMWPVVVPTIPFLAEILERGSLPARVSTLDVLLDLLYSFHPEERFKSIVTPEGRKPLRDLLVENVRAHEAAIEKCRDSAEKTREAELARELLTVLRE